MTLKSNVFILSCAAALAACAPEGFPDEPVFAEGETFEIPSLQPIDPILRDAASGNRAAEAEADLTARGDALRQRAESVRRADP